VTALAVCALLLVAGPAPSQASASSSDLVSAAGSRDLPRRAMNDEVFRNAKGWLIFKGNVDPGWNDRNVQIYKRPCKKGCGMDVGQEDPHRRLGPLAHPHLRTQDGYWYWKGVVPKAGGYGTSVTQVWRTFVE
jgi:hypothetical protein